MILRSVNKRAVRRNTKRRFRREYLPALVAATCYMRTLTNIQAAVLLMLRGLDVPARIMLRASLESLFKLKAVDARSKRRQRDPCRRRRIPPKAIGEIQTDRRSRTEGRTRTDRPMRERHGREVQGMGRETADRSNRWPEKADMTLLYLSTYPVLSDPVHGVSAISKRATLRSDNGKIVALHNEPKIERSRNTLPDGNRVHDLGARGVCVDPEARYGDVCDESKGALKALADAHRNV